MKTSNKFVAALVGVSMVAAAMPAFAMEGGMMNNSDSMTMKKSEKRMTSDKAVDATKMDCVKTAVDAREDAVAATVSSFSSSLMSAMTARKAGLDAAYSSSTNGAVRTGVKAAWSAFASAKKAANQAMRTGRQAAWSKFKTDAKACKATPMESSATATAEISS